MAFVALITGASSGIGEATARRLAREPDARLVLVARRQERLRTLANELDAATVIAADLTEPDAPARIREVVERDHGELHLLVNNAGARWQGEFGDTGWANVDRHMRINFEAPVRATAARRGERRVAIVNVSSTSARVPRPGAAAYSAAKFAIAGWSDSLYAEERPHGVHVGLVLPGYVATEGFPAAELRARAATRWMVSEPDVVAEAIMEAGPWGRAERYVPRYYAVFAALRILAPRLVRGAVSGGAFTTAAAQRA